MKVFLLQWLNEQQLVQKLVAMIDGLQSEEVGLLGSNLCYVCWCMVMYMCNYYYISFLPDWYRIHNFLRSYGMFHRCW